MLKYEFRDAPRLIKINSWYRIENDSNIPFDGWMLELKGKHLDREGAEVTICFPGKTQGECFMNALFSLDKHDMVSHIIKNWPDWISTLENENGQLITKL